MNIISETNVSKRKIWTGRILTGLLAVILVGSAIAKIAGAPMMVDGLTHAGIPHGAVLPIAALELLCLALYLYPRSALLGALLLTGFFGGATVTHIIARENFFPPLLVGLVVWGGVYLRVPELQDLFPLRRAQARSTAGVGESDGDSYAPLAVRGTLNTYVRKER